MPYPSSYDQFDQSKPDPATQAGTAFGTSIRYNDVALRDALMIGHFPGCDYSQTGGSNSEPATVYLTKSSERLALALTWSGGQITTMISTYSQAPHTASVSVATATFTYTSGELTSGSGGVGFLGKVMSLFGKLKTLSSSFDTHTSASALTAHSGLSDMATQTSSAVTVSGGVINNVTIGGTTLVDTVRARETFLDLGTITAGGTVTIDWNAAAAFAFTPNSTTTNTVVIAFTNLPTSGKYQTIQLEIINGRRSADAKITWPSAVKWIGGASSRPVDTALELSGRNIFVFATRDGGTRVETQHLGKGG